MSLGNKNLILQLKMRSCNEHEKMPKWGYLPWIHSYLIWQWYRYDDIHYQEQNRRMKNWHQFVNSKRLDYVNLQTSILEPLFAPLKFVRLCRHFPLNIAMYICKYSWVHYFDRPYDGFWRYLVGKGKRSEITVQCMGIRWPTTFSRIEFYTICEL